MIRTLSIVLTCLPLILACGPQGSQLAPDRIADVSVSPAVVAVAVAQTIELEADVTVASGDPATDLTWASSDPSVASVDAGGLVTGLRAGAATVTATSTFDASKSGSAEVSVGPASIAVTASVSGEFNSLLEALDEAELRSMFADDEGGPYTVFAPADAAFADLFAALDATPAEFLARDDLQVILRHHVIDGEYLAADILALITDGAGSADLETLDGATITATFDGANLILDGAITVDPTDIFATNGVLHVTDGVLLPPHADPQPDPPVPDPEPDPEPGPEPDPEPGPSDPSVPTLDVSVEPPEGGSVLVERDGVAVDLGADTLVAGDELVLTAEPTSGWVFQDWAGACAAAVDDVCTLVLEAGLNEASALFFDVTPSAAASIVTVDPDPPVRLANAVDAVEVRVSVRNASGSPLTGTTVLIDQGEGLSTIAPADGSLISDEDGEVVFTITSSVVGAFSYTLNADGVDLDPPIEITFAAELGLEGYGTLSVLMGTPVKLGGTPTGGVPPFAFTRSGEDLPQGVAFEASDGSIVGSTSETGSFSGSVTVTDGLGQSASRDYTIVVRRPTPVLHVSGQRTATGGGDSASLSWPSGLFYGDLVIVIVTSERGSTTHAVSGFQQIDAAADGLSPHVSAWYKLYSRNDDSQDIAVSLGRAEHHHVVASRVTGHDQADPIGASSRYANEQANGSLIPIPGVNAGAGSLLVGAAAHAGSVRMVVPSSMDETWNYTGTETGERSMAIAVEERLIGGGTGTRTFQGETGGGRIRAGLLFEIRP